MESELSKIDEAQEAEALRRVVSAYLNYSDAAEEDILRWERSYSKLSPSHKVLLKHLPTKYAELRRCVAANTYFICNVLQAFVPPFNMGQFGAQNGSGSERYSSSSQGLLDENSRALLNADGKGRGDELGGGCVSTKSSDASDLHLTDEKPRKPLSAHRTEEWTDSKTSNKRQATESSYDQRASACQTPPLFKDQSWRTNIGDCVKENLSDYSKSTPWSTGTAFSGKDEKQGCAHSTQKDSLSPEITEHDPDLRVGKLAAETQDIVFGKRSFNSGALTEGKASTVSPNSFSYEGDNEDMEIGYQSVDWFHPSFPVPVPPADIDKVRCIIRNIVRDWTEEGAFERAQCYTPILKELEERFPNRRSGSAPSCLVPGAGLARLACEISRLGFVSQGNEFSYYMMICSSFILNQTHEPLEWELHPWIHTNCNTLLDEDQLRVVRFPDLHPGSAGITEGFSMCAGDFVEVYSHPSQTEAWDAVVTCFFIDTAHNIMEYLEIIARILKPGGVWINLGPLLYHFADTHVCSPEEEMSLELSLEDVKRIAEHYGLTIKSEKIIETTYSSNIRSMMQNRYFAAFWTMVKVENKPRSSDGLSINVRTNHGHVTITE